MVLACAKMVSRFGGVNVPERSRRSGPVLVIGNGVLPCPDARLVGTAFRVPGEIRLVVRWRAEGPCEGSVIEYGYAAHVREIPAGEYLLIVRQRVFEHGEGWNVRPVRRIRITVGAPSD